MTTEIVDRVARCLCFQLGANDPSSEADCDCLEFEECDQFARYHRHALAIVKAMREPTADMVEHGMLMCECDKDTFKVAFESAMDLASGEAYIYR